MKERLIELISHGEDHVPCAVDETCECVGSESSCYFCRLDAIADYLIANGITFAKDINVPCKIGDAAWVIRSYKGKKHLQKGIISEMFFTDHMELMIVVKHIGRGIWGKKVFATHAEAAAQCSKGV